ncbi:MAG: hypothetical protein NTY46_09155 [Candidatus Sumerlaeota bacterium]|nr:hypothetical protein [Candidatus Sumerlaeota bacterium]
MVDPELERQYSDCKELMALWLEFHDFFVMGVKGDNITHDKEEQFLEIKSKIAMLHDSFIEAITHDQNIGQEVLNVVMRTITLKHLSRQNEADKRKMEIEWHESYLLLNETIGTLEDKRVELSHVNETQYKTKQALGHMRQRLSSVLSSGYFKMGITTVIVLTATVGVQVSGLYDYNDLGKIEALYQPYRIVKGMWHSFDPNSPWPSIGVIPRRSFTAKSNKQWGDCVITNETREPFLKRPDMASVNKKFTPSAVLYQKEVVKLKDGSGQVEIHTFLMPTANEAGDVKSTWKNAYDKLPADFRAKMPLYAIQDSNTLNGVVFITSDNGDLANDINVNVYGGM